MVRPPRPPPRRETRHHAPPNNRTRHRQLRLREPHARPPIRPRLDPLPRPLLPLERHRFVPRQNPTLQRHHFRRQFPPHPLRP